MRAVTLGLGLLALVACPCCTFSSAVAYGPAAAPRDPARVRVLAGVDPGRRYEVVGLLVTQKDSSDPQELLGEMRQLAAGMGADAVVDLRLELGFGVWNVGYHLSGTAVRYR